MKSHKLNNLNNFIGAWYLDDTSICDELIEFHKTTPKKREGYAGSSEGNVDTSIKESVDTLLYFANDNTIQNYLAKLLMVTNEYKEKYKYCDAFAPWNIVESPIIQYYPPMGGYKKWHTERGAKLEPIGSRHLSFMTYLNDVTDEGETEFYYQQLKIKPEKGLTVIWGADWTFTHRGIPSPSQEKYIVTGWFNYI